MTKKSANIFCFTGENSFALREERRHWQRSFEEKHGAYNILWREGDAMRPVDFLNETAVMPFLCEKRLFYCWGIPPWTKEEMATALQNIHKDVIVVFIEPKPDRRMGSVKELIPRATVKEFLLLRGTKIRQWTETLVRKGGKTLGQGTWEALVHKIGEDQEFLSQEIEKLLLYVDQETIDEHHVAEVTMESSAEKMIYAMNTALVKGGGREGVLFVAHLLSRGQDPFHLWNTLLTTLRQLSFIILGKSEGSSAAGDMHPATRETLERLARKVDRQAMIRLLDLALEAERSMKSGRNRATATEPIEILSFVDQILLNLATS